FLARLYRVGDECHAIRARTEAELVLFRFKDEFVKRRALKRAVAPAAAAQAIARGAAVLARIGVAAAQQGDQSRVAEAVCQVLDQIAYCIYCHDREKDSCAKGLHETDKATGQSALKKNPLGIALEGCPLDEKISEMHLMRRRGDPLAALALVCIDNPMAAGT